MLKIPLNIKKSPTDKRDYIFRSTYKNIPSFLNLSNDLNPVRNQGKQGTCYAQSVATMKEWQEKKDNGFNEYMSPQFFYNNRQNMYDDNPNNDNGMYSRDVMKLLKKIGICKEYDYKYGRIENKKDIPKDIYLKAQKYIIKGYARIYNLESLKISLNNNGPCLITFPVYNYGPRFWKSNNLDEKMNGGHAVTVVGYNLEGFIIRNSWGTEWADKGYTIYKYYDWGSHWEIWTTTDIKNKDIYIPSPKKMVCNCNIL